MIWEALRSLRSTRLVSSVVALIALISTLVILQATRESSQAERSVLGAINAPENRILVIRDPTGEGGLAPLSVDSITALSSVEWAIGLGAVEDVHASAFPDGPLVASRALWLPTSRTVPAIDTPPLFSRGFAGVGSDAQTRLGLADAVGSVESSNDAWTVGGRISTRPPLSFLDSTVLVMPTEASRISTIVVLIPSTQQVPDVAAVVTQIAAAQSPDALSISTSDDLADLQMAIAGELGASGRRITRLVLIASGSLTGLATAVRAILRRTDLGRRRALGATRSYVAGLAIVESTIVAALGATAAVCIAFVHAAWGQSSGPALDFSTAIAVLVTMSASAASVPSAVGAALRDPVRVVRVP